MDNWEECEFYCSHCDEYTIQRCWFSGHERDSTGDYRKCTQCGWEYNGFTGKYKEPYEPYEQT